MIVMSDWIGQHRHMYVHIKKGDYRIRTQFRNMFVLLLLIVLCISGLFNLNIRIYTYIKLKY